MPMARSRKRARSSTSRRSTGAGRRFPSSVYGTAHIPRGGPYTVNRYGASYKSANAEQRLMRLQEGWKGRGEYSGQGGYYGDALGQAMGVGGQLLQATGNPIAAGAGAVLGAIAPAVGAIEDFLAPTAIGATWRKWTGQGAYNSAPAPSAGAASGIVGNQIIAGQSAPAPTSEIPRFNMGSNNVVISHKEFIGDIYAPSTSGTFANRTFPINPGLQSTFPWLAQIAANYDEYTMQQLIFTYRPSITDFVSQNGQVGMLIMATQYNASDPPFTSKQDMLEYDLSMDSKVSQHMYHGVECDPSKLSMGVGKYTRPGPQPSGEDLKTYDHGILNIGVSNCPPQFTNQALGELWVTYTVELRKPKFFVSRGLSILRDYFAFTTADAGQTPTRMEALLWGNAQQNRIGGTMQTFSSYSAIRDYMGTPNLLFTGYNVPTPAVPVPDVYDMSSVGFDNSVSNAFLYEFPADFSGTVKLTLDVILDGTGLRSWNCYPIFTNNGGSYDSGNALSPSVQFGLTVPPVITYYYRAPDISRLGPGAGMTGIADIWTRNISEPDGIGPHFQWAALTSAQETAYNTASPNITDSYSRRVIHVELHLNVVSPATANTTTPNQVLFPIFGGNENPAVRFKGGQLNVEVYNGGQGAGAFNETGAIANNPNSGVSMVNPSTSVPVGWPLGGGFITNNR